MLRILMRSFLLTWQQLSYIFFRTSYCQLTFSQCLINVTIFLKNKLFFFQHTDLVTLKQKLPLA